MPNGDDQTYRIQTDEGDFVIKASAGMPREQVLSLAAARNEKFAAYHAKVQAHLAGGRPLGRAAFAPPTETEAVAQPFGTAAGGGAGSAVAPGGLEPSTPEAAELMRAQAPGKALQEAPMLAAMGAGAATGGASIPATMLASGGAAALTKLAIGGTPGEAVKEGALMGGAELAGPIAERLAPAAMRQVVRAGEQIFGKPAEKAVMEEGIVAGSRSGLASKIQGAIERRSAEVADTIDAIGQSGKTINTGRIIKQTLDDAEHEIAASSRADKDVIMRKINQMRNNYLNNPLTNAPLPSTVGLSRANAIKQELDKGVWDKEVSSDTNRYINNLQKNMRAQVRQELEKVVPGVKELNEHLGGLIEARDAINVGDKLTVSNLLRAGTRKGIGSMAGAGIGAAVAGAPGAKVGAAAGALIPEEAVFTTLSQALQGVGKHPQAVANVLRAVTDWLGQK